MRVFPLSQDLSKGLEIADLSGKVKIPAINAFSMAIRYLKDHALATLNENRTGKLIINETDIHFVLTVPAIWDDRARLFMREAAADVSVSSFLTIATATLMLFRCLPMLAS